MSLLDLHKRKPNSIEPNMFIGGIAGVINTPELMAQRLDEVHPTNIINFQIDGNDVKFRLEYRSGIENGNGGFGVFGTPQVYPTYIIDLGGYFDYVRQTALMSSQIPFVHIEGVREITRDSLRGTQIRIGYFPNLTKFAYYRCFINNNKLKRLYIPKATVFVDDMFDASNLNLLKIYVNPSVLTMNNGGLPSSLQYAIDTFSTVIVPVSDFTKSNKITNLAISNVTSSTCVVNFTPPQSSNPIDFYEVIVDDGTFLSKYKVHQEILGSGAIIEGLTPGIKNIKIRACDEFFNRAELSDAVEVTISNTQIYEAETTALMNAIENPNDGNLTIYPSLTGNGLWNLTNNLIKGLKTNGILSSIYYYYPLLGDVADKQKYNLINISTYPVSWFGGWIFNNKGALANGQNTYANSGFIPLGTKNVNSNGLSVVIGTNNTPVKSDTVELGSFIGVNQASIIQVKKDSTTLSRMNGSNFSFPNADAKGIYTSVKQSETVKKDFKNGVQKSNHNSGGTLPSFSTYFGNMNISGNPYANGYSNQRFQGVLEHFGLTDEKVTILHSLIDTFEEGLGRKSW